MKGAAFAPTGHAQRRMLNSWQPCSHGRSAAARRPQRLRHTPVCAAGAVRKELPIFPLGVVALPHTTVPLMIFEPRYRVLFNTLMDGAPDIEEGLVQKESPFAGTRKFGMCFVDGSSGRMASVGTTLEIQAHTFEPDGKILVLNKGLERFKVTKVVKERPVLICEVEVIPDEADNSQEAQSLASEVAEMFRNVLRLYRKMRKGARGGAGGSGAPMAIGGSMTEPEEEPEEPEELTELNPTQLSFWVASVFGEHRMTQQALLEEDNTRDRLRREAEVLGQTLRFYSAATALESVFSGEGGTGGTPNPPAGGPD